MGLVNLIANRISTRISGYLNQIPLYEKGKAPGLKDTTRARMPAFFEAANTDLPQYG
jgi:hypothetical protein